MKPDPLPPWEKHGPPRGLQRFVPKLGKKPPEGEIGKLRTTQLESGLHVAYEGKKYEVIPLTPEERKKRREDNKQMRQIHSKVRRRKRHGRR